jgi:enoyl-[acyl-carrier-protein] reductase (NADH)
MHDHQEQSLKDAAINAHQALEIDSDSNMRVSMENKVTLIAGGASESGQLIAVALAQKGSDIIIVTSHAKHERTEEIKAKVEASGRRCLIIENDPINSQAIKEIMQKIADGFGRLDVYIDYMAQSSSSNGSKRGKASESTILPGLAIMKAALSYMAKVEGPDGA